jgi:hypothetical protein
LKNNEFLAENKAARRIAKAANGKQLPLFAGLEYCILKAPPPNLPLEKREGLTARAC